jgi:hypothetical protein
MRVIIAGGRELDGPVIESIVRSVLTSLIYEVACKTPLQPLAVRIMGGAARGVDKVGKVVAEKLGLDYEERPADWAKHGKAAGPIRNQDMSEWCALDPECHLILVWDGKSRGSKNMLQTAQAYGIVVHETVV